jgi:hypothetical protein
VSATWTKGATGPDSRRPLQGHQQGPTGPGLVQHTGRRAMNWLTMKWTGSQDRDDDLHVGMTTTLTRIKAAAETA